MILKSGSGYKKIIHTSPHFISDKHGWLIILEESDSIDTLNPGVAAIDDIHDVIY